MKILNRTMLAATAMFFGAALASAHADTVKVSVAAEPYPPFAALDASG